MENGDEENMAFVGVGRGDYVQVLSYKHVGEGQGEFDELPLSQPRRSNNCWFAFMCTAVSLMVFGICWGLVVDQPLFRRTTTTTIAFEPIKTAVSCDMQALRTGDEVEARYAISFMPAGHLAPGARGQLVATIPSSSGDGHTLVVNWFRQASLQGSKVSRSQIMKVLEPGDQVEALVRIEPPSTSGTLSASPSELQVDDLLLATRNIDDRIPEGTYGYVVQVLSTGEHRYMVDFPEFPQFANTKVLAGDVVKAPLVADRVEAIGAIDYGAAGTVAAGTAGSVITMNRERTTYTYVVKWDGVAEDSLPKTPVSGLKLKVSMASERPAIPAVPQGSQGRVVAMTRDTVGSVDHVIVAWKGYAEAGAVNVSRVKITKSPDWSADHRDRCCDEQGIGCVPLQVEGSVDLYNCKTAGEWSEKKTQWCCQWKGRRCPEHPAASGNSQDAAAPQAAAVSAPGPRPMFNCSTHEQWPEVKREYCCLHQSIGCSADMAQSAGAPHGWTTLVSDVCSQSEVGSDKKASISLAMDKARADLMNQDPGNCMVALAQGSGGSVKKCPSSATPASVVEGSISVSVYRVEVGSKLASSEDSAGIDPSACWMMTHRGCKVESEEKAGCTRLSFRQEAPPPGTFA